MVMVMPVVMAMSVVMTMSMAMIRMCMTASHSGDCPA
jgi:hypothetical protein